MRSNAYRRTSQPIKLSLNINKIVRHNTSINIFIIFILLEGLFQPIFVSAQNINLSVPDVNKLENLVNVDQIKSFLPTTLKDFVAKLQNLASQGMQSLWRSVTSGQLTRGAGLSGWLVKAGSYLSQLNQKLKNATGIDVILILKKMGGAIIWFFQKIIQLLRSLIS